MYGSLRGMASAAYQLADLRTDGQLAHIVSVARSDGHSWRSIARRLHQSYGVDVTDETLRNWFGQS